MNSKELAVHLIALAEKHQSANQSAKLCCDDAKACFKNGDYSAARGRVLHSLKHSVGIFHADYKFATAS